MRPAQLDNSVRMRKLFRTVAPRYDFITRAFSYGRDASWKRTLAESVPAGPHDLVLDLACGTGDFAVRVAKQPGVRAVSVDLTWEMLRYGSAPNPVCSDALKLPFRSDQFASVFVGYGLRNFGNLPAALREIRRVLKPGGALASLDLYLPENRTKRRVFLAYMYAQGAFWGALLHGSPSIYTYIPDSLRVFVTAREFTELLAREDFVLEAQREYVLGGIAAHVARKTSAVE